MGYWSAPRARRKTFLSLCAYFFSSCHGACSRFVLRLSDGRVTPRRDDKYIKRAGPMRINGFLHPFHSADAAHGGSLRERCANRALQINLIAARWLRRSWVKSILRLLCLCFVGCARKTFTWCTFGVRIASLNNVLISTMRKSSL